MSDARRFRWAPTSTRMVAGTLVSTAAVVAAVTAVSVPWPTLTREPVRIAAVPAPSASVLSCAGGLLVLGRDVEDAASIAGATSQSVTFGGEPGAPEAEWSRLAPPAPGVDEGAQVFVAAPDGRSRTDIAAAGSATIRDEDIAGFAASACRPPLLESWLVGGAATTGAADLVILGNPGTVPATVDLTVFGAEGPAVPAGGAGLVLPPGTQRVLPLSGLALGAESPVVRVTATGAPVQASLQASITRVLEPGGADQVDPVVEPEAVQIMEGVRVTAAPVRGQDATSLVRILSPSRDATATVTATKVGGSASALTIGNVPLTAGVPTEVSLEGLAEGLYTVRVDADAPVVAGARQATGFDAGDDFAWYAPAPAVEAPSLFAVPAGAAATLVVGNAGAEPVVAELTVAGGDDPQRITVAPGTSAAVPLRAQTVYRLDPGEGSVRAGISMAGDGALAGYPLWSADAAARPIVVYP